MTCTCFYKPLGIFLQLEKLTKMRSYRIIMQMINSWDSLNNFPFFLLFTLVIQNKLLSLQSQGLIGRSSERGTYFIEDPNFKSWLKIQE